MKKTSLKYLLVSFSLILVLALSSGCVLTEAPPVTETPPTETTGNVNSGWTPPTASAGILTLPGIADVVAKVKPSVVAINVETTAYDFFNRPSTVKAAGSGWIIDDSGIIVTNNHVVEGAQTITVTLADDRIYSVNISTVATDPLTDLAILKIDADNLTAASVGDSTKLKVGDWVVAIGNSLGERISATSGIVSALDVSLEVDSGQTLYDLVQTDAAINPGNSGGPLVNMAGEVVGITSAKIAEVGVEGMGYAISINTALPIIESLVQIGYVIRPWLGAGIYTVSEGMAAFYGLAVSQGALITQVSAGSPAEKAGLQVNDIIVSLDDKTITNVDDLMQAIEASQIGQQVKITYWRGKTESATHATLTESPPPSQT